MFNLYSFLVDKKIKKERVKNRRNIFIFSALSAFLGAALSFFLSPNSGKKNREIAFQKIKSIANNLQKFSSEASADVKRTAKEIVSKVKESEEELIDKFDELKTKIQDKIKGKKEIRLEKEKED